MHILRNWKYFVLLMSLFWTGALFGQWQQEFDYSGSVILSLTDKHGKLLVYTDLGEQYTFNGVEVFSKKVVDSKIFKVERFQNYNWALCLDRVYNLELDKSILFSRVSEEILDFHHNEGKWFFLTKKGLYELIGNQLYPLYLLETNKGSFLQFCKTCVGYNVVGSLGLYNLRNQELQQTLKFEEEIQYFQKNENQVFIASRNGIWNVKKDRVIKLLLHQPSELVELNDLVILGEEIYYVAKNELVRLKDLNSTKLPFNSVSNSAHYSMVNNQIWAFAQGKAFRWKKKTSNQFDIYIEKILVNGREVRGSKIKLKSTEDLLQVDIGISNFTDRKEVFYSYLLEGGDSNWSQVTQNNSLILSDLVEGRLQLKLRAKPKNGEYKYLDGPLVIVHKDSPIKLMYLVILVLIVLLLLALAAQIKSKNELSKLDKLTQELNNANQLVREKEKILQLQMNPHFLSNALNSISGMIALKEKKEARKCLTVFSRLMRQMLEQNAKSLVALDQELDFLVNYLNLEQMMARNTFEYLIDAKVGEPESIFIKPMLIQPFVENAIIHGLDRGRVPDGRIDLVISEDKEWIQIEVIDNGVGISEKKDTYGNSHAIKNVRMRLERGEELNVISGEASEIKGTRIMLKLRK